MEPNIERLKEINILYCEDEENIRNVTSHILSKFVKKVFVAENGEEGLRHYQKNFEAIDMIVTDICMPGISGLDMSRRIKAINPDVPIIVTTAFSNSEYLFEAIDINTDKYVLKPLEMDKLLKAMAQSLLYHELRDLYRDALTRLPNRNALMKKLRFSSEVILAQIDIRDFSDFNDLYGEQSGDRALKAFARELKEHFADSAGVYRLESDHFALLFQSARESLDAVGKRVKAFLDRIEDQGLKLGGDPVFLAFASALAAGQGPNLLGKTRKALRRARERNLTFAIYREEEMRNRRRYDENLRWIQRIKKIDRGDEKRFRLFYQPIFSTEGKELSRYEALIRYVDDQGNVTLPGEFLRIAEQANLSPRILKYVVENALTMLQSRKKAKVSINIAYREIERASVRRYILDRLKQQAGEAARISFEILENDEIRNEPLMIRFVEELKALGCRVGIDDFGSGYSNFNLIEKLQPDFIKIDGSLIDNIEESLTNRSIVKAIHAFCRVLGIETIVERVETRGQYEIVRSIGIDYVQGWYFSEALTFEELA